MSYSVATVKACVQAIEAKCSAVASMLRELPLEAWTLPFAPLGCFHLNTTHRAQEFAKRFVMQQRFCVPRAMRCMYTASAEVGVEGREAACYGHASSFGVVT